MLARARRPYGQRPRGRLLGGRVLPCVALVAAACAGAELASGQPVPHPVPAPAPQPSGSAPRAGPPGPSAPSPPPPTSPPPDAGSAAPKAPPAPAQTAAPTAAPGPGAPPDAGPSAPGGATAPPSSSGSTAPPAPGPPGGNEAPLDKKERVQRAIALHDEAKDLYARGEYKNAIAKLEAALALDPDASELVYNLALLHEKLLEFEAAERYYARYIEMETNPKLRERAQITLRRIQGAKKEMAARQPAAPPQPTSRPLARKPPLPKPAVPAPPGSDPAAPWIFATASIAAGSLAIGTFFGIGALTLNPGSDARTRPGVSVVELQADAERAHAYAVVADASFVIAALSGGTAVYLYFASRSGRSPMSAGGSRPRFEAVPPGRLRFRF